LAQGIEAWDATGQPLLAYISVLPQDALEGLVSLVVDDNNAKYPIVIDPVLTGPVWTASGERGGDWFGWRSESAGDVNGDGFDDVVIGADGYHGSAGKNSGKVYLFLGSSSGLSTSPSWTMEGENQDDRFSAPSGSGDVNGDGFDDVLVGAWGYNDSMGNNTGKVYLFLGNSTGLSSSPTWTVVGKSLPYFRLGNDSCNNGDINGDGYDDVVASANAGRTTYVYLGSSTGPSLTPSWTTTNGGNRCSLGDVNGDGYDDLLVSDLWWDSYRGKVYLYLGSSSGLSTSPSWTNVGENVDDRYGSHLDILGDINGDGFDDVGVGAWLFNGTAGSQTGKIYLYMGNSTGLSSSPSWTKEGELDHAHLGVVRKAGDVNADTFDDVVMGAFDHELKGKAYLYLGSSTGLKMSPAWTALGTKIGDLFSSGSSAAGDVNNDGLDDVLIAAPLQNNKGNVYLYLGGISSSLIETCPGESIDISSLTFGSGNTVSQTNTLTGATDDIDEQSTYGCWVDIAGPEQVYQFTPSSNVSLQIDTIGSFFDTLLGIVDPCIDGSTSCNYNNNYSGTQSGFNCAIYSAGITYSIILSGNGPSITGEYSLNLTECAYCGNGLIESGEECDDSNSLSNDGCTDCVIYDDADLDGFYSDVDCNDNDNLTYPGAPELCDELDNNCDGSLSPDAIDDRDEDGQTPCEGDCDDSDATTYLTAPEICDGIDNDCDGELPSDEIDEDGDDQMACEGDCDDMNSSVGLGFPELCDGIDNDCNGNTQGETEDLDTDGQTPCEGDCNDLEVTIFFGADELCDGLDNDCDNVIPEDELDFDEDGYFICGEDCNDEDPEIYPGAQERCNGLDDDCDGEVPEIELDRDGDGQSPCEGDCNDLDPNIYLSPHDVDNNCDETHGEDELKMDLQSSSGCNCNEAGGQKSLTFTRWSSFLIGLFLTIVYVDA
jgi:cysteine-rich repeat protein